MNTLKVFLGFVELALALKFLSKADLVAKTFLLKRELFIAIWMTTAIGLALYLLGVIRFPYDSKVINTPISGYTSKEAFKKFLECGIRSWSKSLECLKASN